ncbi:MAG TPA: hypothetical protein V6D48_08735 [Oculatellaceae cyanobacterium]
MSFPADTTNLQKRDAPKQGTKVEGKIKSNALAAATLGVSV